MAPDGLPPQDSERPATPSAIQVFLQRRLAFPAFCRLTSWAKADAIFQSEGKRILRLAERLPEAGLCQRVTIRPPRGLEPGCCDWSLEMVLEHLIADGSAIAAFAVQLSQGELPTPCDPFPTIPCGGRGAEILDDFRRFLVDYAAVLSEDVRDRSCGLAHQHPWLGTLTAHRWHCLAASHQRMHRRQAEGIAQRFAALHDGSERA